MSLYCGLTPIIYIPHAAVPGAPSNVMKESNVVSWQLPDEPNGEIIDYNLNVNYAGKNEFINRSTTFYVVEVEETTRVTVRVRQAYVNQSIA